MIQQDSSGKIESDKPSLDSNILVKSVLDELSYGEARKTLKVLSRL